MGNFSVQHRNFRRRSSFIDGSPNELNHTIKKKNMATTKWILDPSHSEVSFKVKHMMISTVTGHFDEFEASIETE